MAMLDGGRRSADVIADSPPTDALRSQLRMNGGRVVWTDQVGADTEVFLYTGTTVLQLTNNDHDDEEPAVRGSHVVWTGFPDDPAEGEIFHYDGTTTERVTDDDLNDFDPRVSLGADGVTIAWVKDEGANEVWMFDGCESTRVSVDDTTDDDDVELDENRVAWVRGSGTASEIWTATVTCDVACGNGELEPGEECDDGDTVSGNGCSADCLLEICGNERVDSGEQCDDGNTVLLDGCDAACLFECGNGVVAGDEQCDDGNRVGGDLCDENCIDEICGNGVLQAAAGEVCDDGNTASGDGCSADCSMVEAPAPLAQQRCIQKLNERGAALAKAQHKVSLTCLADAAKGNVAALGPSMTAQGCLDDDPKGKVAKAQAKTLDGETSQCKPGNLPTFAYTSGATVNAAGEAEALALMADLFGANLDLAVISKAVDPPGARCQKSVAQATQALSNRLFKLAVKEKKLLLAGKEDGSLARSNEALQSQLLAFLEADAAGKLAQKEADLRAAARTKCGGVFLDAAFPGCAPSADATALAACATADARCRFCRSFNAFDGLAIDCDDFDDAAANASCP
jgi:cysteine-rich repeat protein